jgi:hypothetical protein
LVSLSGSCVGRRQRSCSIESMLTYRTDGRPILTRVALVIPDDSCLDLLGMTVHSGNGVKGPSGCRPARLTGVNRAQHSASDRSSDAQRVCHCQVSTIGIHQILANNRRASFGCTEPLNCWDQTSTSDSCPRSVSHHLVLLKQTPVPSVHRAVLRV